MALDKLALYNNALLLIGQRKLSSITENRPSRHYLDGAYDLGAVDYCLEIVQSHFASKVVTLNTPATSSEHGLDSVHTLPIDYVKVIGVFSDDKLDQPVTRYIIEGDTIACEHAVIYVRYTSNLLFETYTNWAPSFARVVSAYLAREISIKAAPDEYKKIEQLFLDRVEAAKQLESDNEPDRSSKPTVTLTTEWLKIYNDALLIMGLDEITSSSDDSNRRAKMDRAVDSGVVSDILEDTGWTFALSSAKITYDPSSEPDWGYRYAHEKPLDLHRIDGLFVDEYMKQPLKDYQDEVGFFFSDYEIMYLQYVNTSFLTTPDDWPTFFKRLVASRIAKDASASLAKEGANMDRSEIEYERRKSSAMANDAMSSPPRRLSNGSWVSSRYRGSNRNRPGDF